MRAANESTPHLLQRYRKDVVPAMMKQFMYTNALQVPALKKIVLNVGLGQQAKDAQRLEEVTKVLSTITGQHPATTRAKKSVANFHVRRGDLMGCKVTLRGRHMYEFYERLVNAALPRIRDFRGVSPRSFDTQGNYSLGLREQAIFPEIVFDQVKHVVGMDITFVTSSASRDETYELLRQLGMPFGK